MIAPPGPVLFTTTYPMDEARRRHAEGHYPAQHLWGVDALERAGREVHVLPSVDPRTSSALALRARAVVGDPRATRALLGHRGPGIGYAADRDSLAGVALLSRLGVHRRPVVAVAQPLLRTDPLSRQALLGYDVVVAISRIVHEQLLGMGRAADRTPLLPWGPDLGFTGYDGAQDEGVVVSSGKTRRDTATLLQALGELGCAAVVHVLDAPHVLPQTVEAPVRAPYERVLSDLRRAAVVAVPLLDDRGPIGITELNDALALGKPVVMTRNRYVDVDVEAIGCGLVVERGDAAAWVRALRALLDDPARRSEMGRRGRLFAERHWNSRAFGEGLAAAVAEL